MTDHRSLYEKYSCRAPSGKLELELDEENEVDLHLEKIADAMYEWEIKLASALGFRQVDIDDIKGINRDKPALQRLGDVLFILMKSTEVLTFSASQYIRI